MEVIEQVFNKSFLYKNLSKNHILLLMKMIKTRLKFRDSRRIVISHKQFERNAIGNKFRRGLAKQLIDRPIRLISRESTYNLDDRPAREGKERANASRGKAGFQFHGEQGAHWSLIPAYKHKRRKTIKVACAVYGAPRA